MFRYLIVVLLIHSYNCGLGSPIGSTEIAKALLELATNCENTFLSTQIADKAKECDFRLPSYTVKQLNCLMFYDINLQLCSAIGSAQIVLKKEDYNNEINEKINIASVCNNALNWNVSDLKQFSQYKVTCQKVFSKTDRCSKVCGEDDVVSEDTNFFCRYYNWGSNILIAGKKHTLSDDNKVTNTLKVIPAADVPVKTDIKDDMPASIQENTKTSVKVDQPSNQQSLEVPFNNQMRPTLIQKTSMFASTSNETNKVVSAETAVSDKQLLQQPEQPSSSAGSIPSDLSHVQTPEQHQPINELPVQLEPEDKVKFEQEPIIPEKPSYKMSSNQPSAQKEAVLDNPKLKLQGSDQDAFQGNDLDADDETNPLSDQQNPDDVEDSVMNDFDLNVMKGQDKELIKKIEVPASSFNGDANQREFFPNTLQEGFTDDDDHFFSFFLTAVIIVIFIYILYHNKSKVSKVVLGLIVEGRQSGRRRNSRGHSYRRLDTLEQAMSSTTPAAPPSKIIY